MSEKTKNKRILQITNFGVNIWPKTVTDAVWDVKRSEYLSEILDRLDNANNGPDVPTNVVFNEVLSEETSSYRLHLDQLDINDNVEIEIVTPAFRMYNVYAGINQEELVPNGTILTQLIETIAPNPQEEGAFLKYISYETSSWEGSNPSLTVFYGSTTAQDQSFVAKINIINMEGFAKYIDIDSRHYYNNTEAGDATALCTEQLKYTCRIISETNPKIKYIDFETGYGFPVGTRFTVRRK